MVLGSFNTHGSHLQKDKCGRQGEKVNFCSRIGYHLWPLEAHWFLNYHSFIHSYGRNIILIFHHCIIIIIIFFLYTGISMPKHLPVPKFSFAIALYLPTLLPPNGFAALLPLCRSSTLLVFLSFSYLLAPNPIVSLVFSNRPSFWRVLTFSNLECLEDLLKK